MPDYGLDGGQVATLATILVLAVALTALSKYYERRR
jgi:hypothetical protein